MYLAGHARDRTGPGDHPLSRRRLRPRHPERIGRLVLTPCDAFENFPPMMIRPVQYLGGYVPGAVALIAQTMRSKSLAKSQLAFGPLALNHRPELYVSWFAPARADSK